MICRNLKIPIPKKNLDPIDQDNMVDHMNNKMMNLHQTKYDFNPIFNPFKSL